MKNLLKITAPLLILIITVMMLPCFFPLVKDGEFAGSYRLPYRQGEDYFLYEKYCRYAARSGKIIVIGDSVIWGHYVEPEATLPAQMNSLSGKDAFINLGIDGIHPVVFFGLVDNYCGSITGARVIVGINLLWMSSPKHDLSGEVNSSINHKMLLPQFTERIPAYSPSFEERLTCAVKREVTLFRWIDHARSYMAGRNFFAWTMEHPAEDPRIFFARQDESFTPPDVMKPERMVPADMEWVSPDMSLQWKYMKRAITLIKSRGNSVVAVITPFNRFMLSEKSLAEREMIMAQMMRELAAEGIKVLTPELDKKELFADLSHPSASGYRYMSSLLFADADFAEFIR